MKKKVPKILLSLLLVTAIISSMFSISAIAMDTTVSDSTNLICGENENINMPSYDEVEEWYGQQPTLVLNPEYIKYLQDAEQGDVSAYGGVIPSATPVIDSEFNDDTRSLRTILPTKYNSQEQGYVTSVKDQESRGICWSYAAVSALESFFKGI